MKNIYKLKKYNIVEIQIGNNWFLAGVYHSDQTTNSIVEDAGNRTLSIIFFDAPQPWKIGK